MTLKCFHQLFEAQFAAGMATDTIAVEFGDDVVTYDAFNRSANRLAHHLMACGIGPDCPVGLSMACSPEIFTSMMAIAKAGGAYVPLDPSDTQERRAVMAEDCGLRVLIVDAGGRRAPLPAGVSVVDVSADADAIAAACDQNPGRFVALKNLGYLVYTSGSTGGPKGIAMEHGALANLLAWHGAIRGGSCGLRTLQFCAIGFDFSFHEIFSTLCFGGTLVVAHEDARRDPFVLARFIRDRAIEKLFLPVSAFTQWAAVVDKTSFPNHLKHVVTTGEQLQITPAMRAIFSETGASLHNHYGATEFQDATTLTLSGDPELWPLLPPVGRPLARLPGDGL